MEDTINRILLVMDVSNFEYICIWAAFNTWKEDYKEDCSILPAEETDQSNLPNLLNIPSFKKTLYRTVQKKLESLKWIAKNNHQMELDMADGMDIVFSEDDFISNNFRKLAYPEYKAQRKLVKKQYDVFKIKNYIQDVIFKELELEEKYGYRIIRVPNCESDDIIAVLMKRFTNYMCRILISSDKDFLQLENVNQYDFWGNKVERTIKSRGQNVEMNRKDFLLWKIIRGDIADNIKSVFEGYGDVKSYKLVKDKEKLKQMLLEDQSSADRFRLNRKLIDFNSIPKEMEDKIYGIILEKLKIEDKSDDFDLDGCMEL